MRFRRAILVVLLLGAATVARADAAESAVTELSGGRCRFIADDGEVGDYALKRCPGRGGATVFTEAGPARVSLSFRWGKHHSDNVVAGSSLGKTLEWRGSKERKRFAPHAAIVRVIVRDDDSEVDGKFKTYDVLVVLRIGRREACLMAVIDEAANAEAASLARRTADEDARSFVCNRDRPKVLGQPSRWTRRVIGEPPG
jgi:hypothetical protein